jgi:hypothetical protein
LSLAGYSVALLWMMRLQEQDWSATTVQGRLARCCWTWGLACYLVHLAMAFHVYHHWSHAEAVEHTRHVSGWGNGIFASYLFTGLWLGDALWWWFWPARLAARPAWIGRTLHAYLLFIVFNGTVVFASGAIRWVGIAVFGALAIAWSRSRKRHACSDQERTC